jgi:two-component system, NarL family, sensor kinase
MDQKNPVWQAVVRYLVISAAALALISVLGVFLFERSGQAEAIRDAKDQTRASSRWAVEPELTDGVVRGDPTALREFDRVIRQRVLRDSAVVRVKIWDRSGRIVYSDEPRLIGARYPTTPEEQKEFDTTSIEAEVSHLEEPENRYERRFGRLLEVYATLHAPRGDLLRYEEYYRSSYVSARAERIFREFAVVSLGALILLALIQLPLAWQLASQVRRGQRERVELLQRAVDASEMERRRIAADLHDGAVQSLAGVSYSLSAAANDAPPGLSQVLREASSQTREGIRELRSLLVEIYPPELHRQGLEAALGDLLAPCKSRGLETSLRVEPADELPEDVQALFFRAAQEALRNVVKHADAQKVEVAVDSQNGRATLCVADDGTGFDPERDPEGPHFGLRLLRDLVREIGGTLEIDSSPASGTSVKLEVAT